MSQSAADGVIPSVESIAAIGVLVVTYFIRVASAGDPDVETPRALILATDLLIPVMAASYLFVVGIFVIMEVWADRNGGSTM